MSSIEGVSRSSVQQGPSAKREKPYLPSQRLQSLCPFLLRNVVADDALVITDNRRKIHREFVSTMPIQQFVRRPSIKVVLEKREKSQDAVTFRSQRRRNLTL